MSSVAKTEIECFECLDEQVPTRVGRCLKGYVHGMEVFRVTGCRPQRMNVRRRPGFAMIEEGWFSHSILDD